MRLILFVLPLLLIAGCCNLTSPSSSSSFCSLGTYGPACTYVCEKSAGTPYDGGPNCDLDCMNLVRQQGLGDATTCCKESIEQQCQRSCADEVSALVSKYGADVVTPAEQQDTLNGCLELCEEPFLATGVPLSSCSVLDFSTVKALVESGYQAS